MAIYEEDGKCYKAKILSINEENDSVKVVYTDYHETANVQYHELFRFEIFV